MRAAGTLKTLRMIDSPQGPVVTLPAAAARSSSAPTTTSASPTTPRSSRPPRGAGALRRRHRLGPLHLRPLRPPSGARGRAGRLPRHRGGDHLHVLLERQPGGARHALRRPRPRSSPTRSTTPRSSTRSASRGPPRSRSTRTPTSPRWSGALAASTDAPQADRHRRRLQHGGRPRPPAGACRALPHARRHADRRRLPRPRRARRARGRDRGALRARRTPSTSSPARSARRSAAPRAASSPAGGRSAICSSSAPARSSSPTACRPTVAASARRALGLLAEARLVDRLRANVATFRRLLGERGLEPLHGESAIVPLIVGETRDAIAPPAACSTRASSSPASASRWSRRAPRGSGPRSRPRSPRRS